MTKTQIQLPDELYNRVKSFAAAREWSMAETFRRAIEQYCDRYPDDPADPEAWEPPPPRDLGWRGLSAAQLHAAAVEDMEPQLR